MTSFLLDDRLLLDAGTIGAALDDTTQAKIRNILLTHAHLDHIKDLPFFADFIIQSNTHQHITVFSIPEVIDSLKKHLFNDILWPDFTKIPSADDPVVRLRAIRPGELFSVDGYKVTAYHVIHTAPAVGYLIEDTQGTRLLYLGDSGPNDALWNSLNGTQLNGIIIEASMPDRLEGLALMAGHLTPGLLKKEIDKMSTRPGTFYVTHAKPFHRDKVTEELIKLNISNMKILEDGQVYEI